jgi:hypothetical protein
MELISRDLNLADVDLQLIHIQEQIEAKRNMLFNKQSKLKQILKENIFLEEVKNDYDNYYRYFIDQKNKQIQALELLNNYIDDLTLSGKLTQHNIQDAKKEQKKIIKEMKSIKLNLDKLTKFIES